jgi:NADPH-dependent 2,4-dienoyl-CoA reductase/sulfur reductase-like enzyme
MVVAGAGLAGFRVAQALRKNGYAGSVTLVGDEVHPPYDRPPLSKQILAGSSADGTAFLTSGDELELLQIDWRGGVAATALDTDSRRVILSDETAEHFDRLVIATGATPQLIPGARELSGVYVLRTLDDATRLREAARGARRVCVLGGGVLGCEIAATLAGAGTPVVVVELAESLLARILPVGSVSARVERMHLAAGVEVLLGRRVIELAGPGHVEEVRLDDGGNVSADLVVVALGVRPTTGWLSTSGLDVSDGVLCDEYLRTTADGVFAAGDVARARNPLTGVATRYEHWTNAVEQAELVAHNMIASDKDLRMNASLPYVWSDQYGSKIQVLGQPTACASEYVVARDEAAGRMFALYGSSDRLLFGVGIRQPKLLGRLRALLENQASMMQALAAFDSDG